MHTFTRILSALFISTFVAFAFLPSAFALDATDKPEIEKIIRDYLLNNPSLLGEMQIAFEAKQKAEQAQLQAKALKDRNDVIFSSPNHIEIGNKDATIKVVEFYDYNCPFCQRAMGDMEKILAANPDVKFVIKEWPVLGEASFKAHEVSIAFSKLYPELYHAFHKQLLETKGRKGEAESIALAIILGADEALLRAEMKKPYVLETLRENNSIANDLGITGTPSYVIGDEVVFGAVGYDQIAARIAAMRK